MTGGESVEAHEEDDQRVQVTLPFQFSLGHRLDAELSVVIRHRDGDNGILLLAWSRPDDPFVAALQM